MRNINLVRGLLLTLLLNSSTVFSDDFDQVKITVVPAAGDVYMLQGAGGNIGVLATKEGLLLVDDQFVPLAKKIEKAMVKIADKELKYVVNTHLHDDHTKGNNYFSHKAPIFAHENVRKRLVEKNKANDKTKTALPVVTYQDGINIFLDNEQIKLAHLPNGHTDGDTIVYFKKANVLHTGDLFFELGFPYIDLGNGGSVRGYLDNVNYMLKHFPDDVVIIPGHGKLTNKVRLQEFATMISDSIKRVSKALIQGKNESEIVTLGVEDKYKKWTWSFINEERWIKTLVADLK